jgi:hypothetical protein
MHTWLTLPNLFTIARVALTPVIVYAIWNRRPFAALCLFALAAATDVIDGYLARHFGATTAAGAFLDPIADKTAADRRLPGAGAGRQRTLVAGRRNLRARFVHSCVSRRSPRWLRDCVHFRPVFGAKRVLFFRFSPRSLFWAATPSPLRFWPHHPAR